MELFKRFTQYCDEYDFSFLSLQEEKQKHMIFLFTLDCLRKANSHYINLVLNSSQKKANDQMRTTYIENGQFDAWETLQRSVENNMRVNNRGEILYTLEEINGGYKVFSHAS